MISMKRYPRLKKSEAVQTHERALKVKIFKRELAPNEPVGFTQRL